MCHVPAISFVYIVETVVESVAETSRERLKRDGTVGRAGDLGHI
jgi:hypothetical protein